MTRVKGERVQKLDGSLNISLFQSLSSSLFKMFSVSTSTLSSSHNFHIKMYPHETLWCLLTLTFFFIVFFQVRKYSSSHLSPPETIHLVENVLRVQLTFRGQFDLVCVMLPSWQISAILGILPSKIVWHPMNPGFPGWHSDPDSGRKKKGRKCGNEMEGEVMNMLSFSFHFLFLSQFHHQVFPVSSFVFILWVMPVIVIIFFPLSLPFCCGCCPKYEMYP